MAEQHTSTDRMNALCAEQRQRWQDGDRVTAAYYLAQHPTLANAPQQAVELIYNEVLLREEAGQTPRLEEYLARFPQFAAQLKRVFEVHQAIGSSEFITNEPPTLAGYEILGELGHGGMGVVWKARHIKLNRIVALKMIRGRTLASTEEVARFRAEAEAQARLQHPNIVQIFEVGEVNGQPYFALEYVEGGTLAGAIADLRLQIADYRTTAKLIATLARAVHHAHERGLVHRDLKPGNVLLSFSRSSETSASAHALVSDKRLNGDVPKITDFGLAKRLEESSGQTRTGEILGTPSYMAPEQAAGKVHDIGPRCDIYALGAILYEMLTGRPPFLGESPVDTLLQVRSQDPVAPRRLQPKVPRDLETITLHCLQKDPMRRYADAERLADDLERFLEGKPILARPVGVFERTWRWAKRNPALASLAMALLIGFVGILWQWMRAEREWRRAERNQRQDEQSLRLALDVMNRYITEVSEDPNLGSQDLEGLRTRLLRSAVPFYEDFVRQRPDNPNLSAERGKAQLRLAVLTDLTGARDEALGLFQKCLANFEDLVHHHPDDAEYRADLALIHTHIGLIHQERDLKTAESAFEQALELRKRLVEENPGQPRARADLAASLLNLSTVYAETARLKQSLPPHEEAIRLYEELRGEKPDEPTYRYRLAQAYANLGFTYRDFGDDAKERANFETAVQLLSELVKQHPSVTVYQADLARCSRDLGTCHSNARRLPEALREMRRARDLLKKLCDTHPTIVSFQNELAKTCTNLGNACKLARQPVEAEEVLRQAIDLFDALTKRDRGNTTYHSNHGSSHHNLGTFYLEQKRFDDADKALRLGLERRRELARLHPTVTQYAIHVGSSCTSLCDLARQQTLREQALEWSAEAVRVLGAVVAKEPGNARARRLLENGHIDRGELFLELSQPEKALREWDSVLALNVATGPRRDGLCYMRATTLVRVGEHEQATAEANRWITEPPTDGNRLVFAAGVYALASGSVAKKDASLAERYATKASVFLRKAQGHLPAAKLHEMLWKEEEFTALRGRDDFKKLVADLKAKGEP